MKIELKARKASTDEPIWVQTGFLDEDVKSVVTEDGRRFPAQKDKDGILVIADIPEGKALEAETSAEPACEGVSFKFAEDHNALDVYVNGKLFTSYVYNRGFVKPFLGPVYTEDGVTSYTRLDFNAKEHPHQRSVFIAIGDVNGIDFWNESDPQRGEQHHQGFDEITCGPAAGTFSVRNQWTDCEGVPIVDEKRTFKFYSQSEKVRYVDMMTTFTAAYRPVTFGNTKEAGPLGVRVNEQLRADHGGEFYNAYGGHNEADCWGRAAQWCNYFGKIDGKPYGIAVFDNADNERFPTTWHIRDYGLFAANNLYFRGGLEIPLKYSLTYKWRLVFYEGTTNVGDRFLNYTK